MGTNKLMGVIEVECGPDLFKFKSDFSFLQSIAEIIADPMEVYVDFCAGKSNPLVIRDMLAIAIQSKNGKDVEHKSLEIECLINNHGLQECWLLCRHLLSYGMIGTEKKSQLDSLTPGKLSQLITEPFLLASSKNRLLLWVYHLLSFGVSACIISSLYWLHIVLKTG